MKSLIHLLLLLAASSSHAIELGLVKSSARMLQGSDSAKGAEPQRRQLKGSSKGGSKGGSTDCDSTRVFYWTKDLKKHSTKVDGSGSGNSTAAYNIDELPIYYIGQKKAGFLTEANIVTGDDCSYTGVFSFDPNPNGRSSSQIFYQGSCSSAKSNAVTGGTGDFICASGIASVYRRSKTRVILELQVCNSC